MAFVFQSCLVDIGRLLCGLLLSVCVFQSFVFWLWLSCCGSVLLFIFLRFVC